MLVLSSLDEFMMQENTRAFFHDLQIQTNFGAYVRRLANTDHYLTGQWDLIFANINNFYSLVTQVNETQTRNYRKS